MEPGRSYNPREEDHKASPSLDRDSSKQAQRENRGGASLAAGAAKGAAMLAGAALLSKLIGVLQKIPLQNIAGDRVFGIYNAVYPFYQLVAVLATAGLPTAVSLLIAERLKDGIHPQHTRHTLNAALLLLGATGAAGFVLMWLLAGQASEWIGDAHTFYAIRAASAALLFAPIAAALRGYMQGIGRMSVSAGSQVAEQTVRVAVMIIALVIGIKANWGDAEIAAAVMGGSAAGALAGAVLLGGYTRASRKRRMPARAQEASAGTEEEEGRKAAAEQAGKMSESGQQNRAALRGGRAEGQRGFAALRAEMKRLAVIAVPVALGAIVVPMLGVVDAFTIPRLLQAGGAAEADAMAMFGVYSRAQPLVQLVVMVAGAGAAALVPGLVQARLNGNRELLRQQLSLTQRVAWGIGLASAAGLALLAQPLNVMLYADDKGTAAFALIGCTALAGSLNAVTAPLLQSLGRVRAPAMLLLIAALLKGALNAALVPSYGIEGAAVAGVAALSAAALLGAAALRRAAAAAGAPPMAPAAALRLAAAYGIALAVMTAALLLSERALTAALAGLPPRAAATALALTCVAVGACAYGAAALRGGAVSARELRALPGGGRLAARLMRWRILPPR